MNLVSEYYDYEAKMYCDPTIDIDTDDERISYLAEKLQDKYKDITDVEELIEIISDMDLDSADIEYQVEYEMEKRYG